MSKFEKLLARLYTYPSDFTWDELVTVLRGLGYIEMRKGKTGGSRRKFQNDKNDLIILHEPHPARIIKQYVIRQVVEYLKMKEGQDHERK